MFGRSALIVLAILSSMVPMQALAQGAGDAGVSGIPRGPGSVGGLNNSINDPSGIGNAGRIQAPPPPSTAVPLVPSMSPTVSGRLPPRSTPIVRQMTPRHASLSRRAHRRSLSRSTAQARTKSFGRKTISICRGC